MGVIDVLEIFRRKVLRFFIPCVAFRIYELGALIGPVMDLVVDLVEEVGMSSGEQLGNEQMFWTSLSLFLDRERSIKKSAVPLAVSTVSYRRRVGTSAAIYLGRFGSMTLLAKTAPLTNVVIGIFRNLRRRMFGVDDLGCTLDDPIECLGLELRSNALGLPTAGGRNGHVMTFDRALLGEPHI